MTVAPAAVTDRHDSANPWPSPVASSYATLVFTLAYILSFVDRQILTLLIEPIKADLQLSDTEIGLLVGPAFAICYVTFGFPLGWLVDRIRRRTVAVGGVLFWSAMTALCGASGSYALLFVARMGVGLGEAALSPAAFSLLSDSFPPARLVKAVAVYMSGAIIGVSAAYLLGGQLVAWAEAQGQIELPAIGSVKGWQAPFFILFIPGVLIALLLLLVREPLRRQPDQPVAQGGSIIAFTRSRALAFGLLFSAMGFQSVVVYATLTWTPALFSRRFQWDAGEIGTALGIMFLVAGLSGNLLGATIGSRLAARASPAAFLRVALVAATLLAAVAPFAPVAAEPWQVLALLSATIVLTSVPTALVPTAVQVATPGIFRGRISALYLFATQLIGLAAGPTLVGVFSDLAFGGNAGIGLAQSATVALGAALSAICFALVLKPYRATIAA